MRILVLSTTGHPEANLESARYFIENKSIIDKITILSTAYMSQESKTELLVRSLKLISQAEIEILDIPNGYEESNMFAIQDIILNWINQHPAKARFIFNVTGGTKLISLALDRASQIIGTARAECFYQSRDHHIVWYQRQKNKIVYPMHHHLNLQQRVASRGYQIVNLQPITEIAVIELRYAQFLIEKMQENFIQGRHLCTLLNKLAAMCENGLMSIELRSISDQQALEIERLANLTQYYFFDFDVDARCIHFQNEAVKGFVKGGWLEVYSGYECFKALFALNPQAELAINVTLTKNHTPNEMDVMFIHHAHLYCIECKTARTMASENAKDVLYKLSALNDFGGINQKRAVVSLYSLKEYNLTRAMNADIQIFQEKDILNLSEHISTWIQQNGVSTFTP